MFLPSTLHVTKWLPVLGMKRINSTVAINSHRVAEVPTKSVVLPSSRSLSDQSSDLTLLRYTLGKLGVHQVAFDAEFSKKKRRDWINW